jgi:hypothetical protein
VSHAPSEIEVFASGPPTRSHVDLGLIDLYGVHLPEGWIASLRVEASKLGCDAVFLGQQPRAVCIVYTGPAAPE